MQQLSIVEMIENKNPIYRVLNVKDAVTGNLSGHHVTPLGIPRGYIIKKMQGG